MHTWLVAYAEAADSGPSSRMRRHHAVSPCARVVAGLCLLSLAACGRAAQGGSELHAQTVVLRREVQGLRDVVARLERGEPMLPDGDIAVGIDDTLVRDLIVAQLPLDLDVGRFHLTLTDATVQFRGSPVVRLSGEFHVREQPTLAAAVTLVGALERIEVDDTASTLRAQVAADHLEIDEARGLAQYLSDDLLEEAAVRVRREIASQMPPLQIPVIVRQQIDFPAVTDGPVRVAGSRLPLEVAVSQVTAARGRLWVSVRVTPGAFVKVAEAPEADDTSAADAGATLDDASVAPARPAARKPAPAKPAPAKKKPAVRP